MHIPTFILWFFAVGVPLTLAARLMGGLAMENDKVRAPLFVAILAVAVSVAAWMSWGAEPIESECRPAGPSIVNDC